MDITYILEAGKRIVASKFNTNFNDVKTAVDALETDVSDLQAGASNVILPDGSKDFTNLQSYKANAINNATNATPIVITAVAHGYVTGNKVFIKDVGGNTAANGEFTITRLTADTFSLDSSVGNGAYTSGGTAIIYPDNDENLTDKQYVDKEIEKTKVQFGTSSTASATAEKAATVTGFTLTKGAVALIAFTNANTATTPTLNVNSTGAKAIYNEAGTALSTTNPAYFPASSTIEFTYNGTNWVFKKRVVENYINGTSWYRKWSDGFIEQGGVVTPNASPFTVNLLTPFITTNYSTTITVYGTLSDSTTNGSVAASTINSFNIYKAWSVTTIPIYWISKGY